MKDDEKWDVREGIGIDRDRMRIPVTAPKEIVSNRTVVTVVGRITLPVLRAEIKILIMLVRVRTDGRTMKVVDREWI